MTPILKWLKEQIIEAFKITDEVMRFIEQSRDDDPQLNGPALVERIQQHFGLAVHRRTVERALARPKKKPR